jgi:ABC-type branched-subunit amino acid transport system permease subunit
VTNYLVAMATLWSFYALLALGLNLQWGYAGLVNFGLVAYFGIGAYASALLALRGVAFPVALAAAAALAAALGLVVALSTFRLREDYLAVVTLGFSEIVRLVVLNEVWLTEGARGLTGIPRPLHVWAGGASDVLYLGWTLVTVLVVFVMAERIRIAPFGRVLRAIREDADVAALAGKNVPAFKLQAFVLGAAVAGVAGSLYAHYLAFLSPDQLDATVTIYAWIAVIVGGSGNNRGALLGAFVLMTLLEGSRFLKDLIPVFSGVRLAALRLMVVGFLLVGFMMFRPEGLWREEPVKPGR